MVGMGLVQIVWRFSVVFVAVIFISLLCLGWTLRLVNLLETELRATKLTASVSDAVRGGGQNNGFAQPAPF